MLQTTASIKAGLNWSQLDTQSQTVISDIGSVTSENSLTDGSGDSQANLLWHDVLTLPSGGSTSLNLQSLTRVLFSKSVNVGFQSIKCIAVKNKAQDKGAYFTVSASGVNGLTSIFDGASSSKAPVHPKCSIVFPNYITGWTIDNTHKQIELNDAGGSGITLEISIIGVSGSGG